VARPKRNGGEQVFRVLPRQVNGTIGAALRTWLPGRTWSEVRRLLKSRRVMLNGNACVDLNRRLRLVDVVKVLAHPVAPQARAEDVRIHYVDKHVVVVEKPAGVTSTRHADERRLPARKRQIQSTLDEMLPRLLAKHENRSGGGWRPVRPVHRLDRETSGLMVFARTADAQKDLQRQFRDHRIERRYIAVAQGNVQAQTIESRLVRDRGDGHRGSTNLPNVGKTAITHVEPVERLGEYTLVECRLETGRTHQIRIHLAEQGHPICGEKVYTQPLFRPKHPDLSRAPRLALCAVELGFVHLVSGERLHFEMPLSRDLQEFVERLRREAANG
jgi:23S rRNA pseudouridine1911/1915/1917 synthase